MATGLYGGMLIRDAIRMLEHYPLEMVVHNGFWHAHSWRGAYSELAVEPTPNISVVAMLATLQEAIGSTYTGWKGGEYTMSERSEIHLAYHGSTGEPLTPRVLDYMLKDVL